jgi:predicted RNase H-like HicB family nuclease
MTVMSSFWSSESGPAPAAAADLVDDVELVFEPETAGAGETDSLMDILLLPAPICGTDSNIRFFAPLWSIISACLYWYNGDSMRYLAYLQQDEDGIFLATCPSLPGCVSQGATRSEAQANIREAIELYLQSLQKHGEPIPPGIEEEVIQVAG